MVQYYISFFLNGEWTESSLINFKRGLYDENPLDESLDTSIIVDVPTNGFVDIPPFTPCRITSYDQNQTLLYTKYYLTGKVEQEAVTTFGG